MGVLLFGGIMIKYEDVDWDDIQKYNDVLQLPDEIWVKAEEGKYNWISNYGRMKSLFNKDKPKIRTISDNGAGYKKWALSGDKNPNRKGYKTCNYYVHRLVAKYFLPNPENLPQVNHMPKGFGKHDNRACVLEWCTEKHNIKDAHDNGQMVNRTKVNTSIDIKPDIFVEEMYRVYKDTGKIGETARLFGVSRTTLSSIVNKRSRVKITDKVDLEYSQKGSPQ